MRLVFKNVRKVKSMKKQKELMKGVVETKIDICAVNETGLVGDEYIETTGTGYTWYGSNREREEERGGGVGFIVKNNVEIEVVKRQEDLMAE